MLVVNFSHTKKQEKEYLVELLSEKEWFEREQFSVFLPQSMTDAAKELLEGDKLLKQKITQLKKAWQGIEVDYFKIVKQFCHKKILLKYKCHISRFGPKGKYHRPNLIFIRLRTKNDEKRVIETIGHELPHLLFTDFFEFKKLNYSEREGMIDALILRSDLVKLFPKYEKQSVGKIRHDLFKLILPK